MGCIYCDPYVFVGIEQYKKINDHWFRMKLWHNVYVPSTETYDILVGINQLLVGTLAVTANQASKKGVCEQQDEECVPVDSCNVVVDPLVFTPSAGYPNATLECETMGSAGETPGCGAETRDEYKINVPELSVSIIVTVSRTCSECTVPIMGKPDDEYLDEQ